MIQAGTISTGSGRTLRGRRRVLDELDQPVAIDHLARRHRDVAADHEILGADRLLAADRALPVLDAVLRAAHEVHAAVARRVRCRTSGIGQQEVRRREHVEHLARGELDHVLVLLRDAAHAGGRVVPPLLLQQERLVDEVVRPLLPRLAGEAPVLRQRLDAGLQRCRPAARSAHA